jgi:protein phosphatase-4 regulatory subunit 3
VWPGQGRHIEAEEEDYFNADDDEDEVIPSISASLANKVPAPIPSNALKRKRRVAISGASRAYRPPNVSAALRAAPPSSSVGSSTSLGSLVDYEDEDEAGSGGALGLVGDGDKKSGSSSGSHPQKASSSQLGDIPPSPRLVHQPAPPRRLAPESDEDSMFESLVRPRGPPPSKDAAAAGPMSMMASMRQSEKRRRDTEDEEDGLLERLSKSKKEKVDVAVNNSGPNNISSNNNNNQATRAGPVKGGEDPPKKIKLKFGMPPFGAGAGGASLARSSPSTKDGDTGG